jgi:hypothetical protein
MRAPRALPGGRLDGHNEHLILVRVLIDPSTHRVVKGSGDSTPEGVEAGQLNSHSADGMVPKSQPPVNASRHSLRGRDGSVDQLSHPFAMYVSMSYNLVLECGCTVYVSHDPLTNAQCSRVLERRGPNCPVRDHTVGARVFRSDLIPEAPSPQPASPQPPAHGVS